MDEESSNPIAAKIGILSSAEKFLINFSRVDKAKLSCIVCNKEKIQLLYQHQIQHLHTLLIPKSLLE